MSTHQARRDRFHRLSAACTQMSSRRWSALLQSAEYTQGWGVNHSMEIAGERVFVKRVPLTALEHQEAFDTRNLYDLPMYYHYGVGSAGFGVFRELVCHVKTTSWVLQGQTCAFPLLYHYRILPAHAPWKRREPDALARHLRYWNSSAEVAHFLQARAEAPYELVLILEWLPQSLYERVTSTPRAPIVHLLKQADQALSFLNQRGVLHMDAHLANIMTDSEQVYISDFGLALDRDFELDADEEAFWQNHQGYDRAQNISALGLVLSQRCDCLEPAERNKIFLELGIDEHTKPHQKLERLLNAMDRGLPGQVELGEALRSALNEHRETLIQNSRFFDDLRENPRKDTPWPAPLTRPFGPNTSA